MGEIILITGGGRSGKSTYALEQANAFSAQMKTFVATCEPFDSELKERVKKHQDERNAMGFQTLEEPLRLAQVIEGLQGVVVIDCLTLWVNQLLYVAEKNGKEFKEEEMQKEAEKILAKFLSSEATFFVVSNEVGWGVTPGHELSRRFVDCLGRLNQMVARQAREVVLMCAGLPMKWKDEK